MTSKEKTAYRKTKAFKDLRKEKLDDADYRCQLCFVKKTGNRLQLHHIDPSRYKADDEADWTIVLCAVCHKYIESKIKVLNNPKNPKNVFLYNLLKPFSTLIK